MYGEFVKNIISGFSHARIFTISFNVGFKDILHVIEQYNKTDFPF